MQICRQPELTAYLLWGLGKDGFAEGNNDAVGGGVENFEEGDEEGVYACEQAKIAADGAAGERTDRVAKVA